MRKSRFTEEQIMGVLRKQEQGAVRLTFAAGTGYGISGTSHSRTPSPRASSAGCATSARTTRRSRAWLGERPRRSRGFGHARLGHSLYSLRSNKMAAETPSPLSVRARVKICKFYPAM